MANSRHTTRRILTGTRLIHGMRISLVAAALICGVSTALAASKALLTGFNGIAFETPLAAAKHRLGANARADKSPDTPATNILLQSGIPLYGETLSANYTFGKDDRMKIVYATVNVPTGNFVVCSSHWENVLAGLRGEFGAPDTSESTTSHYAFANGAKLEAMRVGACLLMLVYTAPGYQEQ